LLLLLLAFTVTVLGKRPCGSPYEYANEDSHDRTRRLIVGGNEVPMGKWPWQVLLKIYYFNNSEISLSGTVISDQWILTAGHCIPENFVAGLAYSGIVHGHCEEGIDSEKPVISAFKSIIRHPQYTFIQNDIALVKLEDRLHFDETLSPVCLPNGDQSIPDDALAVAVGFG
ncbi:hypothetical protein PFISCL1PPCAC_8881, partial [Pristionchus fissidentatus]